MPEIEYDIFLEAGGSRPLATHKVQVGFKYRERGEIICSQSFSIPELEDHIGLLEAEGREAAIFKEALKKAKESES